MRFPVDLVLVLIVAIFAAIGFYRTVVKPDRPWHRWVTLAGLVAVLMLPGLTGWAALR